MTPAPQPSISTGPPPSPPGSAPSEAVGTTPGKPPSTQTLQPRCKREPAAPGYKAQSRKGPTWQERSPAPSWLGPQLSLQRPTGSPQPLSRLTSPWHSGFHGTPPFPPRPAAGPRPPKALQGHFSSPSLQASFLQIPTQLSCLPKRQHLLQMMRVWGAAEWVGGWGGCALKRWGDGGHSP